MKVEIEPGWGGYANDGEHIGDVGEVGADFMRVSTGLFGGGDLYVPTTAVAMVADERVELNLTRQEIDAQGWHRPPTHSL